MSLTRDYEDGKVDTPPVVGYTSSVFGATASAAKLKGLSASAIANALGIAAAISPVNAHRAWLMHAPAPTIKYALAGALTNAALTAAEMGELGHRGDLQILDDSEFGYPRFIGTTRWEPVALTSALGVDWRFPKNQMYKPYPHCRVMGAPLDLLIDLITKNDIKVSEVDAIKVFGEGWAVRTPIVHEPRHSKGRGRAVLVCAWPSGGSASHRTWQEVARPCSRLRPFGDGTHEQGDAEHPSIKRPCTRDNPSSRPSRVEIDCTWPTFAGRSASPKAPLARRGQLHDHRGIGAKFRKNADAIIPASTIDKVCTGPPSPERRRFRRRLRDWRDRNTDEHIEPGVGHRAGHGRGIGIGLAICKRLRAQAQRRFCSTSTSQAR